MDVRLASGDVYLSPSGMTEYLSALREAAQRVLIAATTARGAFRYQRTLGTDYAALGDRTEMTKQLDMLIREACAGITGVEVTVTGYDAEQLTATLCISYHGDEATTEVDLHGNI